MLSLLQLSLSSRSLSNVWLLFLIVVAYKHRYIHNIIICKALIILFLNWKPGFHISHNWHQLQRPIFVIKNLDMRLSIACLQSVFTFNLPKSKVAQRKLPYNKEQKKGRNSLWFPFTVLSSYSARIPLVKCFVQDYSYVFRLLVKCCYIILIMCMHVDICLWLLISSKAGGYRSPRSWIKGSCVPPDVPGSWTWVLYKQGDIGGVSLETMNLTAKTSLHPWVIFITCRSFSCLSDLVKMLILSHFVFFLYLNNEMCRGELMQLSIKWICVSQCKFINYSNS